MTPTPAWRPPTLVQGHAVASITARQAEVLTALCHGASVGQIARGLGVAENSARKLTARLIDALGARDRCNAVALAASGQIVIHIKGES